MEIDLQLLVDRFYDYFLDLYHKQSNDEVSGARLDTARPGQPFLAFGNMGAAITPEMFKLQDGSFYQPLVTEQFSGLANMLPVLEGTSIQANGVLTADAAYAGLLAQAQPLTPEDMPVLGALKDPAQRAFDESSEPPRIHGGIDYHPALPIPPDWPLPTGESAWSSYSYRTMEETSVTATAPRPGAPRPTAPWRWRVAPPELREAVRSLGAVASDVAPRPAPQPPAAMQAHLAVLRAPMATLVRPTLAAAPAAMGARTLPVNRGIASTIMAQRPTLATVAMKSAPMVRVIQSRVLLEQLQAVREQSQPKEVTSSSMELSFRYCLVTARRPWLSGAFLTARNWYIRGLRAGEIASGTGLGTGSFEVLPTTALCVRNLAIKAAWSEEERGMLPDLSKFGPFALVGHTLEADQAALLCPGTQIIGWVMEPMPMLPPNSDPALPAA